MFIVMIPSVSCQDSQGQELQPVSDVSHRVSSQGVQEETSGMDSERFMNASQGSPSNFQGCSDDEQHPTYPEWSKHHLDTEFMELCGERLTRTHAVKVDSRCISKDNGPPCEFLQLWIPLGPAHNFGAPTWKDMVLLDETCEPINVSRIFRPGSSSLLFTKLPIKTEDNSKYSGENARLRVGFNVCRGPY